MILGLIIGVLAAGTLMYYIQPTVKTAVAKAFGAEAQLAAAYTKLASDLKASAAAKPAA